MRRAISILVVAIACAALVACAASQAGTFKHYERKKAADQTNVFGDPSTIPIYEKTGMAVVGLGDGTEVSANCPIEGLEEGDTLKVKQNDDGTWVVMGKQ